MSRYIIDNPEPPGAMEQFRGNVNRLGQTMLQLKMAEIERKRKLEEDIAGEGRKMQGELGLLREKAKIEQESPLGMLEQRSKLASFIKDTGQEATPEQMEFLGINRPRTMTKAPQIDVNAPLSIGTAPMKSPVFGQAQGQMVPEGGTIENTPFGPRMKDVKVFSPEAEKQKELLKGTPTSEAGKVALAKESLRNIDESLGLLFPDGKFNRETAWGSNPPRVALPFVGRIGASVRRDNPFDPTDDPKAQAAQDVFRKLGASLSGRQLIQTGVAARPEETERLMNQFAPGFFSNPEAARSGLTELQDFYKTYLYIVQTKGLQSADEWATQQQSPGNIIGSKPVFGNQSAQQQSGRVSVISPDGTEGTIPTNQLEEALQGGYRRK